MPISRALLRRTPTSLLAAALLLAACSATTEPDPSDGSAASPVLSAAPTASPTPTPTPEPSPTYTNPPDAELLALIPDAAGGATVAKPSVDQYGLTPGDIGAVFGDIGLHFRSLALAYIEQPRLSLYAMRMDGPMATTADLEPHLAEIGRYVGIAGLDRKPWSEAVVADREVWQRPEDNATAAGTMIYTWIADDLVFLMIGVDDTVNRALVAALPGIPAPSPSPSPPPASVAPVAPPAASPAG
jgi:hypothetical protein